MLLQVNAISPSDLEFLKIFTSLLGIILVFMLGLLLKPYQDKRQYNVKRQFDAKHEYDRLAAELDDINRHCKLGVIILANINLDLGKPSSVHFRKMKIYENSILFSNETYRTILEYNHKPLLNNKTFNIKKLKNLFNKSNFKIENMKKIFKRKVKTFEQNKKSRYHNLYTLKTIIRNKNIELDVITEYLEKKDYDRVVMQEYLNYMKMSLQSVVEMIDRNYLDTDHENPRPKTKIIYTS